MKTVQEKMQAVQAGIDDAENEMRQKLERDRVLLGVLNAIHSRFPDACDFTPHTTHAVGQVTVQAQGDVAAAIRVALNSHPIGINLVQASCTSFQPVTVSLKEPTKTQEVSPFYIETRALRGYPQETALYFYTMCGPHLIKIKAPLFNVSDQLGCWYKTEQVAGGHEIRDYRVVNKTGLPFDHIRWWASSDQPSNLTFYIRNPYFSEDDL